MKKAFTLAEVLLTLAIIGVVAALTIPAVIIKVQQDQYVVGLKKAYNTLKAVERESIQENGEMSNWDWTGTAEVTFTKYFKPHFDILKDCGATTDDGCLVNSYKLLNDAPQGLVINSSDYYRIITSDGISYAYRKATRTFPGRQGYFFVDINGTKVPNKFGRDLFEFSAFPTIGIKPNGSFDINTAKVISDQNGNLDPVADCNASGGDGWYCAAKVLAEGAMNY